MTTEIDDIGTQESGKSGELKASVPVIGIDFGTYQSRIAYWNGSNLEHIYAAEDHKLMLSFVSYNQDTIGKDGEDSMNFWVAKKPRSNLQMQSGGLFFNMKRFLGRVDKDPSLPNTQPFMVQSLDIGDSPLIAVLVKKDTWRSIEVERAITVYFQGLKRVAEDKLKQQVHRVALTVPVAFSRFQLRRLKQVCVAAGLDPLMVHEPVAVATLYARENERKNDMKNVVIFNMGAGYCDVAVCTATGGCTRTRALGGLALGFEDILVNTINMFNKNKVKARFSLGDKPSDIKVVALLRDAFQTAIHMLSRNSSAEVIFDESKTRLGTLSRAGFEKANREVFQKCEILLKDCIIKSKINIEEISDVMCIGGCEKIHKIKEIVTKVCKKGDLYTNIDPLDGPVLGAALFGAIVSKDQSLSNLKVDISPLSMTLGIRTIGNQFTEIVPKHTELPCYGKKMNFTTVVDGQKDALIAVYEGDHQEVKLNNFVGYFLISWSNPTQTQTQRGVPRICVEMSVLNLEILKVSAQVFIYGKAANQVMDVKLPLRNLTHGAIIEVLKSRPETDLALYDGTVNTDLTL